MGVKTMYVVQDSSLYSCVPERGNPLHTDVGLRLVHKSVDSDARSSVTEVRDAVIQVVRTDTGRMVHLFGSQLHSNLGGC